MPKCPHCNRYIESTRTLTQSNALHRYFELVADELNSAGWPIKRLLRYRIDLDWDKDSVKNLLWRPIQQQLLQKKSTTELKKIGEIDVVYEHLNRFLAEVPGVHIPFPKDETKGLSYYTR